MKAFKRFQWLTLMLIVVVGVVVVSCKDSNSPTTPAMNVIPTDGEVGAGLDSEGFPSDSLSLVYETSIGNHTFKVYAEKSINAAVLLEGIDAKDSAETIHSKIDAKRIALYPEEQIAVDVELAKQEEKTELPINANVYLNTVKAIFWWGNVNGTYAPFWSYTTYANAANLYIRVISGSYDTYLYYNGAWHFYQRLSNITVALSSSGYDQIRGFKGMGKSSYNKADIVMYFYR